MTRDARSHGEHRATVGLFGRGAGGWEIWTASDLGSLSLPAQLSPAGARGQLLELDARSMTHCLQTQRLPRWGGSMSSNLLL